MYYRCTKLLFRDGRGEESIRRKQFTGDKNRGVPLPKSLPTAGSKINQASNFEDIWKAYLEGAGPDRGELSSNIDSRTRFSYNEYYNEEIRKVYL